MTSLEAFGTAGPAGRTLIMSILGSIAVPKPMSVAAGGSATCGTPTVVSQLVGSPTDMTAR